MVDAHVGCCRKGRFLIGVDPEVVDHIEDLVGTVKGSEAALCPKYLIAVQIGDAAVRLQGCDHSCIREDVSILILINGCSGTGILGVDGGIAKSIGVHIFAGYLGDCRHTRIEYFFPIYGLVYTIVVYGAAVHGIEFSVRSGIDGCQMHSIPVGCQIVNLLDTIHFDIFGHIPVRNLIGSQVIMRLDILKYRSVFCRCLQCVIRCI